MMSSIMHSCDESDDSLRITSVEVEVSFDGQFIFSRGLSNMVPLWQRIDICSPVVFKPTT